MTAPLPGILVLLCLLGVATAEQSQLPLIAPIFTDHMVLQRNQRDWIWGWDAPGHAIAVTIDGQTATTQAEQDGRWRVLFTPPAVGGPYALSVAGSHTMTLNDVLVGDVWLCSGQSNMEFGLKRVSHADEELAHASYPSIRLFVVGKTAAVHPQLTLSGHWSPCTPATAAVGTWDGFSAVGYFFGRELHQRLTIPIGLIQVAWGATPAEAWNSRAGLSGLAPDFAPALASLAEIDRTIQDGTYSQQRLRDGWYAQLGLDPTVSTTGFDATGWKTMRHLPHYWGAEDDPRLDNFQGALYLRREIELPAAVQNRSATLSLGVLDDGDVTFVNGERVGGQLDLAPRRYVLRAGLLKPGPNAVAIWLLNAVGAGGMVGRPADLSLTIPGLPIVPLDGDWRFRIERSIAQLPLRQFEIRDNPGWPSELFNGMIAPLAPYGITGAIWYQGEANVDRACQYRALLPALITSWRAAWQQGDFPFLVVQLPNFGPLPGATPRPCAQAELREAQALAARTLHGVGVVATIDIGDPGDLHPANKQEVGRRLALEALVQAYHQAIPSSGPQYRSATRDGATMRIAFDHAEGLQALHGPRLRGFALAGEDQIFAWADAAIVGDEVVLTAAAVPRPVAARYDWDWSPDGNLANGAGLPAFPFRTDDWPGVTVGRK
jgi:sialate O-acetylesterase